MKSKRLVVRSDNPTCPTARDAPINIDAPEGGAAAREKPTLAAAEISSRDQEKYSQWLSTLSEPELDVIISLKELAMKRAAHAGHPHLADKFDLRTQQALGVVLLNFFKERLKETSVDPNVLDGLALLCHSDADFTKTRSDSEVARPKEDLPTPVGVKKKRMQMQDEWH